MDGHWKSGKPSKPKPKLDQYGLPPRQTTVHVSMLSDNVYSIRPIMQRSSIWSQMHATRIRSLQLSCKFIITIISFNEKESGKLCLDLQIHFDGPGGRKCLVGNALKLVTLDDKQDKQDKQGNEKKRSVEAISDNQDNQDKQGNEKKCRSMKRSVEAISDKQDEVVKPTQRSVEANAPSSFACSWGNNE